MDNPEYEPKRLVINYTLNIAAITHLTACKHTPGLNNPGSLVGTWTRIYLSGWHPWCSTWQDKPNINRSRETRQYIFWHEQSRLAIKYKNLGRPVRIRPETRSKGVKLRFGCDHIAPSGFGVADQEGTDSYVLFGSNTTYVWTGSPQVIILFIGKIRIRS